MIGSIANSLTPDMSSALLQQLKATGESVAATGASTNDGAVASVSRSIPPTDELTEMGTEFESVFLSMLLKELRQSLDEGFFSGESSDSMGGMFDLFISKHLAEASPLGIGEMVASQIGKIASGAGATKPSALSAIAPLNAANVASYEKQRDSSADEGPPSVSVSA